MSKKNIHPTTNGAQRTLVARLAAIEKQGVSFEALFEEEKISVCGVVVGRKECVFGW